MCRDKNPDPRFDSGQVKAAFDPKSKSLYVSGNFWDEGDIITEQTGSGKYIDRFGKEHSHGNRKMPGAIIIEDTKSAKKSYKEFLKHADQGEMNSHFRVANGAKKAIKDEIRKQAKKANIKKGIMIGAGVALPVVGGVAAYKHYKKKEKKDAEENE